MAEIFKNINNKHLLIADFNIENNQHSDFDVDRVPRVYMYKKGDKTNILQYNIDGGSNIESLIKFIKDNARYQI